jgi:serine phosphatase RsbU (regulator of sigma subunit)
MNKNLQNIEEFISQSGNLSDEKKEEILKALKDANKELEITAFKLERTEKVKRTTAILLEETIEELEQKRKAVEEQAKIINAENDRKSKELEDARQLQLAMLPRELPKLPHLDIAVYMKTATEVGGDYYDFHLQPDGTLTVLVGDATGHGMMSGMMVSIMKSFFIADRNNIELKSFFENSNLSIKDMQLGRLMMALMAVQITSKKIIATNAGMPLLLYFRNKSQKAGEFVINNMPLGAMKGTKYTLKEINYEKGDTLLLMSDGFAELKNKSDEQYGYDRVKKEFVSVAQNSSNDIIEHLKTSATEWTNGKEPDDDVTFVVIKVK